MMGKSERQTNAVKAAAEVVEEPHPHDVLCGRGGKTNSHPGNEWFRRLVKSNRPLYRSCPKHTKLLVSKAIVQAVHQQDPPGRFLEIDSKDKERGLWSVVSYKKSVDKTSQALREKDSPGEAAAAAGGRPPPVQSLGQGDKTPMGSRAIGGITEIALRNSGLSPAGSKPGSAPAPSSSAARAAPKRKAPVIDGDEKPAASNSWWGSGISQGSSANIIAKRQRQENVRSTNQDDGVDDVPLPPSGLESRQSSMFRFFSSASGMFGGGQNNNNNKNDNDVPPPIEASSASLNNNNNGPTMNNALGLQALSSAAHAANNFDNFQSALQQQQQMMMMTNNNTQSYDRPPSSTNAKTSAAALESEMRTAELRARLSGLGGGGTSRGGNRQSVSQPQQQQYIHSSSNNNDSLTGYTHVSMGGSNNIDPMGGMNGFSPQTQAGQGNSMYGNASTSLSNAMYQQQQQMQQTNNFNLQQQQQQMPQQFYSYMQGQQQMQQQQIQQMMQQQMQEPVQEAVPPPLNQQLTSQVSDWLTSFWPLGKEKQQANQEQAAAPPPKLEAGISSTFINLARSPSRLLTALKSGVSSLFDSSGDNEQSISRAFGASAPPPPPSHQQMSHGQPNPMLGTTTSARRDSLLDDYEETPMESRLRSVASGSGGGPPHQPPYY